MKKQLLILFLFGITKIYTQGFVANSPNTLYPVNSALGLTPINVCIGHNTPVTNRVFHTLGQIRFAGLTNDNSLTRVLVTDANGDVKWRDASTFSGGLAWLLGGNDNTTVNASNNIIGTLANAPFDFRIWTSGLQRARYLANGNYELGTTNGFTGSQISYLGGANNNTLNDQNLFTYGELNTTNTSSNISAIGKQNEIFNSSSVMAFGEKNKIVNSEEGGVFGEALTMINSHGSFMAGGHSQIQCLTTNRVNYNWTIGNRNLIQVAAPEQDHNLILGTLNNIFEDTFCHIHGNRSTITSSKASSSYGNDNSITNGDNTYILGSGISNNQVNSTKLGFNNNRTMTITQRGIDIQMDPTNPNPVAPAHNLEVMAGSSGATVPEVMLRDLPIGNTSMDMVVISGTDELFRIPNCCKSGGGITNTCITQGIVPRVDASGTGNLECSQIYDDGTSVGIGTTGPFSYAIPPIPPFSGGTVPTAGTISLDVNGVIRCAGIFATSDEKLKTEIKPIQKANEIVKALNGKTYSWNKKYAESAKLDNGRHYGFLAQEVEKIIPEAIIASKDQKYAVEYNAFIPIIVESQKEIIKENEALKSELLSVKEKLANYDEKFALLEKSLAVLCESGCVGLEKLGAKTTSDVDVLYQSIPNPTDNSALINYYLVRDYNNVTLKLSNKEGKLIQEISLNNKSGQNSIQISLSHLASQTYYYTVSADNKVIGTKSLQVIK